MVQVGSEDVKGAGGLDRKEKQVQNGKRGGDMKQIWLSGSGDYEISCRYQEASKNKVLLICHGFGSSQYSPTVEALHAKLPKHGITTVSFDFPAHGDSPVGGEFLTVERCMDDLVAVEAWACQTWPGREILHFGSSFGAYITLLYLAQGEKQEKLAFLRSAAVDMYGIVCSWFSEAPLVWQKGDGEDYFVPDYDYARPMKITRGMLEGLRCGDVFSQYPCPGIKLKMIHGSADSTAPVADARRFAQLAGAQLVEIADGEHRLMEEGQLEQVIEQALQFFG